MPSASDTAYPRFKINSMAKQAQRALYPDTTRSCVTIRIRNSALSRPRQSAEALSQALGVKPIETMPSGARNWARGDNVLKVQQKEEVMVSSWE